jgi:hypothetical protein
MLCVSEEVLPGQVAQVICVLRRGTVAGGVYMDPPTAAAFTIERVDALTPGEMHVLTSIAAPGVAITVRNDAGSARRFQAEVVETRDLGDMAQELARIVERDWGVAYDGAKRVRGI